MTPARRLRPLRFELLKARFAVCRLPADAPLPEWASSAAEFWIARTADELSVVCEQHLVPEGVTHSSGLVCLRLAGPFALTETGVLASFLAPLAEAEVPVFAVSTYDTDHVFIPEQKVAEGLSALRRAGHELSP